ncbi:MAG TPA: hypothetical protein VJX67_15670 [Blastocatellia bacterium]|nr:hypothetical protein [Blastocatellia bacterium]
MQKVRAFACSLALLAATVPSGLATVKRPAPAPFLSCSYQASFDAHSVVNGPCGSTFACDLQITAFYNPAKSKLGFTVLATFSGDPADCTVDFSGAGGTIGPFAFTMGTSSLVVGTSSFPVTNLSGTGWTASGAIKPVTGFDCTTWTLQGSTSGTSCSGSSCGYINQGMSATGPAVHFSCSCL